MSQRRGKKFLSACDVRREVVVVSISAVPLSFRIGTGVVLSPARFLAS